MLKGRVPVSECVKDDGSTGSPSNLLTRAERNAMKEPILAGIESMKGKGVDASEAVVVVKMVLKKVVAARGFAVLDQEAIAAGLTVVTEVLAEGRPNASK